MQGRSGDSHDRTPEDVDADLGHLLGEAVGAGRGNRRRIRWLAVSVVFNLLVLVLLLGGFFQMRHIAKVACERTNRQGTAYVNQWTPVLRAPRAPLREGATAAERAAYEANTALRTQFERDLRQFDPVDC